jgi:hypothetical protein
VRLVPNLDPKDVQKRLVEALRKAAPWGLEVEVTPTMQRLVVHRLESPRVPGGVPGVEEGLRRGRVAIGCGGSIPFVEPFARELGGRAALLIGVEDPYTTPLGEREPAPRRLGQGGEERHPPVRRDRGSPEVRRGLKPVL